MATQDKSPVTMFQYLISDWFIPVGSLDCDMAMCTVLGTTKEQQFLLFYSSNQSQTDSQ
jgi:hypothetical protein